jgi:hypothetical protein
MRDEIFEASPRLSAKCRTTSAAAIIRYCTRAYGGWGANFLENRVLVLIWPKFARILPCLFPLTTAASALLAQIGLGLLRNLNFKSHWK